MVKQADGYFCKCGAVVLVAAHPSAWDALCAFLDQHDGPGHRAVWLEQWKPRSQAQQLELPLEASP